MVGCALRSASRSSPGQPASALYIACAYPFSAWHARYFQVPMHCVGIQCRVCGVACLFCIQRRDVVAHQWGVLALAALLTAHAALLTSMKQLGLYIDDWGKLGRAGLSPVQQHQHMPSHKIHQCLDHQHWLLSVLQCLPPLQACC